MNPTRICRRPGCEQPAVATLTSVYADSTIVLGPLATQPQPEAYDLCEHHVDTFTAPRGWQVIRLVTEFEPAPPSDDDLIALAEAVKEASRSPKLISHQRHRSRVESAPVTHAPGTDGEIARRGHLRVLKGDKDS